MSPFSDYIVYVDESGDHSLTTVNKDFPLFVLTFCVFEKAEYTDRVVPALQRFKFRHFGHDMVVLHEREVRKAEGAFTFLTDAPRRTAFLTDLSTLVEGAPFHIVAVVVRKAEFVKKGPPTANLYHFALRSGLVCLDAFFRGRGRGQGERQTHVVFEARGKKEDDELELEFRRVCDGDDHRAEPLPFRIVIADKQINSTGLQLADLTARPIGRHVMNPQQSNRAYDIIRNKLCVDPATNEARGFGLKCHPESE